MTGVRFPSRSVPRTVHTAVSAAAGVMFVLPGPVSADRGSCASALPAVCARFWRSSSPPSSRCWCPRPPPLGVRYPVAGRSPGSRPTHPRSGVVTAASARGIAHWVAVLLVQPTTFELVIHMKTAKTLELAIRSQSCCGWTKALNDEYRKLRHGFHITRDTAIPQDGPPRVPSHGAQGPVELPLN